MHVRTGPSRGKDARQVKLELAKLQHDLSTLLESYRVARSRVRELPHHTKKLASGVQRVMIAVNDWYAG